MNNALIIFVRKPEIGKVKTRLAAGVGNEKALDIYNQLLCHTYEITKDIPATKFVFYNEEITADDLWNKRGFLKKIQQGETLGDKMENAFKFVFGEKYNKTIIIGSDCFELDAKIISQAFHKLDDHNIVIGPANDGGYYLFGMTKVYSFLFKNKKWSTDTVFEDTLQDIEDNNLTAFQLPVLTDVDTEEDYLKTRKVV